MCVLAYLVSVTIASLSGVWVRSVAAEWRIIALVAAIYSIIGRVPVSRVLLEPASFTAMVRHKLTCW